MSNNLQQASSMRPRKRLSIGLVGIALMAMVLPACNTSGVESNTSSQPQNEQVGNATTGEVNDNLAQLVGTTVTLRSEAEVTDDPNSFKLDDETFSGEDVLVINATGQPFQLPEDDDTEVQVTGEVRQFAIADTSSTYNLDLNPDTYAEYENKPVIFAQSLALAPKPSELTEAPEEFYNQQIAVEGEVSAANSPNIFTLQNQELFGGEDLLVIAPASSGGPVEGEKVAMVGELRPFVKADFERDYDLTWDLELQQNLEAEYENQPVFVAQEVYPSAKEE